MEYPAAPRFNLTWLFCAIVMALGWGIRGELGGPNGAAVPGALLGLALAVTSGRPAWVRAAPIFGMAGALGFALGGNMSYGLLIGYTKAIDMQNVAYGYAVIGLVGGLWGAFGAGCIGLAASPVRYPAWQVILFVLASAVGGEILHWLLVDLIGLHANPGRGDSWPQSLAAVIGLVIFSYFIKRDPFPARLAFWGFVAGSTGFMLGESFQVIGSFAGPDYNWWKVMEQSFGFIMGAGVAWAFTRESRSEAEPANAPYALTVFGVIVTLWLVPVLTFENMMSVFSDPERDLVTFDRPGGALDAIVQFRVREFAVLAVILVIAYAVRTRNGKLIATDFAAKLMLTGLTGAVLILSAFKKSAPQWGTTDLSIHTGFLIMALIVTVWTWLGFPLRPFRSDNLAPPPLRIIAPIYFALVLPILIVALAAASIATHRGEWRDDARIRFGDPPPGVTIPEEEK